MAHTYNGMSIRGPTRAFVAVVVLITPTHKCIILPALIFAEITVENASVAEISKSEACVTQASS